MDTQLQILYAARSGLYKGIRRGDLDLTKTCFDLLWEDGLEQQRWLRWRLPIFTLEEAFHRIGEMPMLLRGELDEKTLRTEFYRLTVGLKSKDCYAFIGGTVHPLLARKDCAELRLITRWLQELNGRDPLVIADPLFEFLAKQDLDGYELAALSLLRNRALKGGRLNDRLSCITGMLLIGTRGLDQQKVAAQLLQDRDAFVAAQRPPPRRLPELPWYCYDRHTLRGVKVAYALERKGVLAKHGLTLEMFQTLWLVQESFYVPREYLRIPKEANHLTAFDSYWWPRLLVATIPPAAAKDKWKKMRPLVMRLLKKGD